MSKLREIIETLRHHRPLESKHKDHALSGDWKDFRDCHIEPNWLLIYRKSSSQLILARRRACQVRYLVPHPH
jgi:mRNA interferase YafQ